LVVLGSTLDDAADGDDRVDTVLCEQFLDRERHVIGAGDVDRIDNFRVEETGVLPGLDLHHIGDVAVELRDDESKFYRHFLSFLWYYSHRLLIILTFFVRGVRARHP